MRIGPFIAGKDGGPESTVHMFGFEVKKLFSILLLRFDGASREAYHSHAFNCVSWILRGRLLEKFLDTRRGHRMHAAGDVLVTRREDVHQVDSHGVTWVLTLRGPWRDRWVDVKNQRAGVWWVDMMTHKRVVEYCRACFTRVDAAATAERWAAIGKHEILE